MSSNAVVTPHHLSAAAARTVMEMGGNAVDGAVAAVAAQGVVAPETCGVGGDLFALVHSPGWERPLALNSSGRAGSKATAESLRMEGLGEIPRDHPAAVTIPGCVDGMTTLITELGQLDIAQVLAPAIALARDGFEVSAEQAGAFDRQAALYATNPAVASFYPDGRAVEKGDHVRREDLARTLESVAVDGRDAFYCGRPGEDIIAAVQGLISSDDLTQVQAEWVDPIGAEVRGMTAWTIPPNSQGYLGPATLAVFESLDPPENPSDPMWWHLLIEAYRCLAWERDDVVSDPGTLALPADLLLDRARLARAAASVDRQHTGMWPVSSEGGVNTAYMCAADANGMSVSIIQSNYNGTGSALGAGHSGFLLQDRGRGFTLMPGHPNELGPGKRPLHTLSPTLWAEGVEPRWVLGTRGGAVQPQLIAQVAARAILTADPVADALRAPRWTISSFGPGSPSAVAVEAEIPEGILADLEKKGHVITSLDRPQPGWGPVSIIGLDGPLRNAAADPRVDTATAYVF